MRPKVWHGPKAAIIILTLAILMRYLILSLEEDIKFIEDEIPLRAARFQYVRLSLACQHTRKEQ